MEVHHHSHTADPDSHRGRKKWTHYFWEFLMLFLAVFCGFMAENIREHKIEKHREMEFMKSMLIDLQRDSSELAFNLKIGPHIIEYSDSLLTELKKRPLEGREKKLYHFLALLSDGVGFRYYDRTISQLRYSGGFRLVKSISVSNAALDYDVLMREAVSYNSTVQSWGFISSAVEKTSSIFEYDIVFKIFDEARKYINGTDSIHFPAGLKLITYNDAEIKKFASMQRLAQVTDQVKLDYSQRAFELNKRLDSLIRKEYHLN